MISGLASASVYLHDAQLAARVAATPRPYRGYWAHGYSGVAGPVTFYLALCAVAAGDLDDAVVLHEECDRVLTGFGCHGLLPWYRLSYANALRRRGSEHDRRRAMHLLDQVRHGAAAIKAPNLVAPADQLAARIDSEANR